MNRYLLFFCSEYDSRGGMMECVFVSPSLDDTIQKAKEIQPDPPCLDGLWHIFDIDTMSIVEAWAYYEEDPSEELHRVSEILEGNFHE